MILDRAINTENQSPQRTMQGFARLLDFTASVNLEATCNAFRPLVTLVLCVTPIAGCRLMRWLLLVCASAAWGAELTVTQVWSRATVAGQEAGGVYATITSVVDDRLLAAESTSAAVVEVHEHIRAADGVMQMRAVAHGIAIAGGTPLVLKPGSYHIMLIGLKQPLLKGSSIALTLRFAKAGTVKAEAEVLDPWAMAFDDR